MHDRHRPYEVAHHHSRPHLHAPCTLSRVLPSLRWQSAEEGKQTGTRRLQAMTRCQTLVAIEPECIVAAWRSGSTLRPRRRPRELTTVYGVSCAGSTLGTLERCWRPHPMSPSKLMLVLDESSTEGERTVVSDVLRTHTRTRNTCNKKSVGWRST